MDAIKKHFTEAQAVLAAFIADEKNLQAIEAAGQLMVSALANGKKIISCGNGGSMCDAMHFAEELSGRYRNDRKALAAISISDPSHISCVGNDYGYDFIFSRYLEALANETNRKAQFKTVIALNLNGQQTLFTGIVSGEITKKEFGNQGFGYDSIFKAGGMTQTFAEIIWLGFPLTSSRLQGVSLVCTDRAVH